MPFFEDLAQWSGNLRATANRPFLEMRQELKRQQLDEALNNVLKLDAQRQQAMNNNGPDGPTKFDRGDQLRLAQAMSQAGISQKVLAEGSLAEEKLKAFQGARTGVSDNPYVLGNLANGLDISPTRHAGGVTYNRFWPRRNGSRPRDDGQAQGRGHGSPGQREKGNGQE